MLGGQARNSHRVFHILGQDIEASEPGCSHSCLALQCVEGVRGHKVHTRGQQVKDWAPAVF